MGYLLGVRIGLGFYLYPPLEHGGLRYSVSLAPLLPCLFSKLADKAYLKQLGIFPTIIFPTILKKFKVLDISDHQRYFRPSNDISDHCARIFPTIKDISVRLRKKNTRQRPSLSRIRQCCRHYLNKCRFTSFSILDVEFRLLILQGRKKFSLIIWL